jgi:hypothetical protein
MPGDGWDSENATIAGLLLGVAYDKKMQTG